MTVASARPVALETRAIVPDGVPTSGGVLAETLADRVAHTLRRLPGQQPTPCVWLTLVHPLAG